MSPENIKVTTTGELVEALHKYIWKENKNLPIHILRKKGKYDNEPSAYIEVDFSGDRIYLHPKFQRICPHCHGKGKL